MGLYCTGSSFFGDAVARLFLTRSISDRYLNKRKTKMPTFQELCRSSASKGGMEKTVEFCYDEHVAVVMAAFRERTQTPHSSMPLVHRVDVLEERAESSAKVIGGGTTGADKGDGDDTNTDGWAVRRRRFFAANDAPEWVRKVSGGDYLRGTEQIEWSEAEGVMNMYTVNESHAHLITAEEICIIRADPDRPTTGTIKTLTVRARLRVRGWWTMGLSHVAEKFLLGRYTALVEQGRRIELDEIARWRAAGKADALLAAAAEEAERLLDEALARSSKAAPGHHSSQRRQGSSSPVSTLSFNNHGASDAAAASSPDICADSCADNCADSSGADGVSGAAAAGVVRDDGIEDDLHGEAPAVGSSDVDVESQLNTTGSTDVLLQAGLSEDQWLMMRYKYDVNKRTRDAPATAKDGDNGDGKDNDGSDEKAEHEPESPLHGPLLNESLLGDVEEKDEEEAEEMEGCSDSDGSFVSNADFKSFYSASEAGTAASECAFSARDGFSRGASPISWFSSDSPSMSALGVSPSPGRNARKALELELELGFKDFDLESTFDASFGGGDSEKLEKEAEALVDVDEQERAHEVLGVGLGKEGVDSSSGSKSDDWWKKMESSGGRWRRLLVRAALIGASVAIAHEKRDQLRPIAFKAREQVRATVLQVRRRLRRSGSRVEAAPLPPPPAAAAADETENAFDAEIESPDPDEVVAAPPATALPVAADASPEAAEESKRKSSKGSETTSKKKKKKLKKISASSRASI